VASLSQGRTAAAQCGLFTYKSVPVIFEPPCSYRSVTRKGKCIHKNFTFHYLKRESFVEEIPMERKLDHLTHKI